MSESSRDDDKPFKEWLTATEMLALRLPAMPQSRRSMFRYAKKLASTTGPHLRRLQLGTPRPSGPGARPGGGEAFHYTCLPPEAIVAYEARFRPRVKAAKLVQDRSLAKLGKSVLGQAEGGKVRAFILQAIIAEPKASAARVRELCVWEYGHELTILAQGFPAHVPMPPLRTFQQFLKGMRETDNADA